MSVIVYHIGPTCVQCNQTKKLMDKLNIDYTQVDLREHPVIADQFKQQGLLSAPIVVAGSNVWSGFKYERIVGLTNHPAGKKKND